MVFALLSCSSDEDIKDMIKRITINHPDSIVDEVGLTSDVMSNAIPQADQILLPKFQILAVILILCIKFSLL